MSSKINWEETSSGSVLKSKNGAVIKVAPREKQWTFSVRRDDKVQLVGVYLNEKASKKAAEEYFRELEK